MYHATILYNTSYIPTQINNLKVKSLETTEYRFKKAQIEKTVKSSRLLNTLYTGGESAGTSGSVSAHGDATDISEQELGKNISLFLETTSYTYKITTI